MTTDEQHARDALYRDAEKYPNHRLIAGLLALCRDLEEDHNRIEYLESQRAHEIRLFPLNGTVRQAIDEGMALAGAV
jgi:hypothetical protein